MKKIQILTAVAVVLLSPVVVGAQTSSVERAAATITQDDYAWRVGVIAHDSMQGRDTPSPGLDKTAQWIASEFRRFGLRGGGDDGGFIQNYPLEQTRLNVDGSGLTAGATSLRFGEDLLPVFGSPGDLEATGGLILISGSTRPGSLSSVDLSGQHAVVVLAPGSEGITREVFGLLRAVRDGDPATLIIANSMVDEQWDSQVAQSLRPSVRWPDQGQGGGPGAPMLQVRTAALERLLQGTGISLEDLQNRAGADIQAHRVDGMSATLKLQVSVSPTSAPNVVGILEGSDPELKDEYIVYSGHMDHVGIGTPDENGDSIFNGADDDASGTIAVVEVAEAMSSLAPAPRRSMIFLVVSGEEKGLWGSLYYADNPTVPIESLVANLNTDMVGRNWPDTIVAIGKEHSDLGETLNRVNDAHPELRMTAIDDIWPEENFYGRSDHFNFARKGVPILFFFNGTHDDYHGRDDEPERMDAEKAARIARLVFYLGLEVANADDKPKWNPESYKRIVSDQQ
jgi:hypothetical protein